MNAHALAGSAVGPIARRVELMRHKPPPGARGPHGRLLLGELSAWAEPVARMFRDPFALLEDRVRHIRARYGQDVVLVGWSLGGIFARELAKRHPGLVAKVVTMGTPFSGTLYANNAWQIYQLVTGHSVEQPPIEAQVSVKPPVETVALWSPRDGVVSPRSACGRCGERDRAIALRCTHLGFAHSAEAIRAVAEELERG